MDMKEEVKKCCMTCRLHDEDGRACLYGTKEHKHISYADAFVENDCQNWIEREEK